MIPPRQQPAQEWPEQEWPEQEWPEQEWPAQEWENQVAELIDDGLLTDDLERALHVVAGHPQGAPVCRAAGFILM